MIYNEKVAEHVLEPGESSSRVQTYNNMLHYDLVQNQSTGE